jgi:hypothetical protein
MLKILAFGNADKKLSINFLAYLIGCEVLDANAVLRKVNAKIVNAGKLMPTFDLKKGVTFMLKNGLKTIFTKPDPLNSMS